MIDRKHWRKGYARQAIKAVIDWASSCCSVRRFFAAIHPDNDASRGLACKLGFIETNARRRDEIIYVIFVPSESPEPELRPQK
jgi:RimJ/RimL family protein N-acetyltransferase